MTMPNPQAPAEVYAAAFQTYWDNGWRGILPLPPRHKKHPPEGYTGNHGRTPSYPDLYTWAEERPDANIALRLPETIIGIDVDNYAGKTGATTLATTEARWGDLPPTWRTTSRDDGISGIRLYRAPIGLSWPSVVGDSIEIIRHAHRYAIVWPSTHPDTGNTYRWINPHGTVVIGQVPTPDDFPLLPQTWVDGLTGGRQAEDRARANLTDQQTQAWLNARPHGQPCRAVQRVIQKRSTDLLTAGTTRHDTMLDATQRIAHLAAEGHPGTHTALDTLHAVFMAAVTKDGSRRPDEADLEWDRAITGAVRNAAPLTTTGVEDPCVNPFSDLPRQAARTPDQLIREATRKAEPWPSPTSSATTSSATSSAADAATTGATESPTPSASAATSGPAPDDAGEEQPPSWRPVDLTPYLDGTWTPDRPTLFTRTDGQNLLYPGKVHDFHGESESGKSLVAQAVAAAELQNGRDVLYVDFEDDAGPVTRRMINLGATPHQIRAHFTYVRPETSPYALAEAPEWAALLERTFTLAVLDGVTDALVQFGGGTKENDDITAWHRMVPRQLSRRTGAAVVLVDHVIKNTETRGRFAIGGQAKMAALDGASYSVEVTEPIGKGMAGTITLRIGKDRPGEIRANCGAWRASDRSQEAANVIIDSTGDDHHIRVEVAGPKTSVHDKSTDDGKPFRPTGVMEKLSRLVEASREPMSQNQLLKAYKADGGGARDVTVYEAINLLADEGHLAESRGPRGARTFRSANVYRQRTDPASDAYDAPIDLPTSPLPDDREEVGRGHDTGLSTPVYNDSVTDESAGHDLFPPLPTSSRPLPGRSQAQGTTSSRDRVGDVVATHREEVRPPRSEELNEEPTSSQERPTGPDWRLDYQIGEWVHRVTGEVWDGGDDL